jgi:NTE family protein
MKQKTIPLGTGAFRNRLFACLLVLLVAGCATRPPEARISQADPTAGYRIDTVLGRVLRNDPETLFLVAFSGGGTRAAAFSYGVLEELRRTPVVIAGRESHMIDQIDAISSVSGGSFTALAYALYGERLFDVFEPRFLKRNVEQGLIEDVLNPFNWPPLMFGSFTRSDLAIRYYDEILFDGATFGDLLRKPGPLVVASSTEFSSGYRFTFTQNTFDLICANLSSTRLALAATASSAVPVAFAPVTLKNWGGTCGLQIPEWVRQLRDLDEAESLSLTQRVKHLRDLENGERRPWLHLVDGGISDNLGLRAILELMEILQLREEFHTLLNLGKVRRVAVIVVDSQSSSSPGWDRSFAGPNLFDAILQASSVPIDNNSMDSIVLMQMMIERWKLAAEVQKLESKLDPGAVPPGPQIDFYPIVLDFAGIPDVAEREFFLGLPTSLALPDTTIDRLRGIGGTLLRESPQFQKFLRAVQGPRVH